MSNQLSNLISFDQLFNPIFLSIAVIAFVVLSIVFWIKRKRLSKTYKTLLILILTVLMIYFIFLVWAIVGFGSNHGPKP
jgi:predicted PurR-regulated permease PerM